MELLPHAAQVTFAWLLFTGSVFAAIAFVMWGIRWVKAYRDENKHAEDTQ